MGWLSIWRRAVERPINAFGLVTLRVRLRKDEAEALVRFLNYWDWTPRPGQRDEYAAMSRAGRRVMHKLTKLGFEPPPHRRDLWYGLEHLRPTSSPPWSSRS